MLSFVAVVSVELIPQLVSINETKVATIPNVIVFFILLLVYIN